MPKVFEFSYVTFKQFSIFSSDAIIHTMGGNGKKESGDNLGRTLERRAA